MTDSLNFDVMADRYDQTRTVNPECLAMAVEYLANRFPPDTHNRMLDAGIGTGRIAQYFVQRRYDVVGIDISQRMLDILRRDAACSSVRALVADVTSLPMQHNSFDLVLAVHLFYFVAAWRDAVVEILRVLKPNGAVILLGSGHGQEIPFLNDRYRELCASNHPIVPVGVSHISEVLDEFRNRGCSVEAAEESWEWTERVMLGDALDHLATRSYSFAHLVPETVHTKAISALRHECLSQFTSLDTTIDVPNRISLAIVTPAAP